MPNIIVAIIIGVACVALYLGYTLGCSDTEYEYNRAAREERRRERENSRRFADIERQGRTI